MFAMSGCAMTIEADDESIDETFATVPALGEANTLDLASWNIEFFGSTANGPTDEALQLANARDVIAGTDFDIWGVAEIVSASQFNTLKSQLPGYAGFLANDPSVLSGSSFYTAGEQKVGVLFKTSVASVTDARLILTQNNTDFAGRPPLQVTMRVTVNGVTQDLVLIVLHAKAFADADSLQRRLNASIALKAYLDSTFPTQKVAVVGDYNDDVDTSIVSGQPSPYANFVNDSADYTFPTKELSDAGERSTVSHPQVIDHHLDTNELMAQYITGSATIYRVDEFIPRYGETTSDHFPVLTSYSPGGGGGGGSTAVSINEVLANEPGSSTAGEFIELVNRGTTAADLSGWTLSDLDGVRHRFAAGTSLAAGKAIVVFAGATAIPGGLTNAVASTTGSLSLNNGGDTVTLRTSDGTVVNSASYTTALSSNDGVSMNRNPDGSTGGLVLHTALSTLSSSPGKRVNGTAF
jgi:endonuclease/exonuclease/phosphatase family metal-dependent hydrolase